MRPFKCPHIILKSRYGLRISLRFLDQISSLFEEDKKKNIIHKYMEGGKIN